MNSLEFINEQIEMQKVAKEAALKMIEDYNEIVPMDAYKKMVEHHDKEIQILQQIKTELEAWEVVKDKITTIGHYDTQEDYEEDINEHKALCLVSNLKFQNSNDEDEWFIPLNEKEAITLKKALEKNDND